MQKNWLEEILPAAFALSGPDRALSDRAMTLTVGDIPETILLRPSHRAAKSTCSCSRSPGRMSGRIGIFYPETPKENTPRILIFNAPGYKAYFMDRARMAPEGEGRIHPAPARQRRAFARQAARQHEPPQLCRMVRGLWSDRKRPYVHSSGKAHKHLVSRALSALRSAAKEQKTGLLHLRQTQAAAPFFYPSKGHGQDGRLSAKPHRPCAKNGTIPSGRPAF